MAASIKERIQHLQTLLGQDRGAEASMMALAILHDTVGPRHPMVEVVDAALKTNWDVAQNRAVESVVALFQQGVLDSPALRIAHEIEGSFLDLADGQVTAAERATEPQRSLSLAIAAFLAGAVLEDAMRRLCDANGIAYEANRTTLSKLQAVLYQPNKNIEVINASENKQITAWGDTRNKADHGHFADLTQSEVLMMVIGVRGFVDKHLP
jgi:hypothetical protein